MLLGLALLACAVIAIESTRSVPEPHGQIVRDLGSVWLLAIAIALPPAFAFLAPFLLMAYKLRRIPGLVIYRRVVSAATLSLGYGLASAAFRAIPVSTAGPAPGTGRHALTWTASVAACWLLALIVNHGLLIVAIKLSDPAARARDQMVTRESVPSDALEMSLAVCVTLVVQINPVLIALALPAVVLCRRSVMRAQLAFEPRIDTATGLLNAETWRREAEATFSRALRKGAPLAMAMVGVDGFQPVIEDAGPLVGDQVLRDVAGMLRNQLPGNDLIGRAGSHEFAILFRQAGRDEARRISERLRDHIAGEAIAAGSGFVFRLTVSIGVAAAGDSSRTLAELAGAAAAALGHARNAGWSNVRVFPG